MAGGLAIAALGLAATGERARRSALAVASLFEKGD
jgi:hypothetical protein